MSQKILILGAKGMLGQELALAYSHGMDGMQDNTYHVIAWDREDIDVTDFSSAEVKIREVAPDIIFNAVAYNAVDACEEDEEEFARAMLLNASVPEFLAKLAHSMDVIFVHFSTDYVFGGNVSHDEFLAHGDVSGDMKDDALLGFDENVEPKPVCRYAISKREGEKNVIATGGKYYIIRLSKLFGKPASSEMGKKSFFEIMLAVGREKTEVQAVDEEMSCFTYAPDLARFSKDLVAPISTGDSSNKQSYPAYGIYHCVNESPTTWYGGVVELYHQAGLTTKVHPVTSESFPRPAKRPIYSVLRNTKRPKLRPYQEAMKDFLK
jgi:dTDP-4-dehydrorhamnose reductase